MFIFRQQSAGQNHEVEMVNESCESVAKFKHGQFGYYMYH